VTKAITAAVIAILNVNIRFRPLAHCNSEAKKNRGRYSISAGNPWWFPDRPKKAAVDP
jgi:hypothetical protein